MREELRVQDCKVPIAGIKYTAVLVDGRMWLIKDL